jgi:PTS system nitrogen regulatory IIA component
MLLDLLNEQVIQPCLKGTTKEEIIEELVGILDAAQSFDSPEKRELAKRDVWKHEQLLSTGMQHGIAIPHAKTSAVSQLSVCFGISRVPVEFQSVDKLPARIFIMILSPPDRIGPHIRFLSELGIILKQKKIRKALLQAQTKEDILTTLGHSSSL